MRSKADAWKKYTRGAYLEMVIEQLPRMAAMVAEPLSKVKGVTIISTGGDDIGASRLTGEVSNILAQVPPIVEKLTGINIGYEIQKLDK